MTFADLLVVFAIMQVYSNGFKTTVREKFSRSWRKAFQFSSYKLSLFLFVANLLIDKLYYLIWFPYSFFFFVIYIFGICCVVFTSSPWDTA